MECKKSKIGNLVVLWNIYLHNDYKVQRFRFSLGRLNSEVSVAQRFLIRGPLRKDGLKAIKDVQDKLDNPSLLQVHDETYRDWKLNTIAMVLASKAGYFILMQEDYLLMCKGENLIDYINECESNDFEIATLTAHPGYMNLLEVASTNTVLMRGIQGNYFTVKDSLDQTRASRVWLTPLVGMYSRQSLLKLLRTGKPALKRFPPFTPFDFEQRPNQAWFLPIKFAIPHEELFACIDDGPKGTSLQERGLYPIDFFRIPNHNVARTAKEGLIYTRIVGLLQNVLASELVNNHKSLNRLTISMIHRVTIIPRLKYSLRWWTYIIVNRFFRINREGFQLRARLHE